MISAIVLAAGQATRFGGAKVVARLSGVPLVRHVVDRLQRAAIDELIVVAGDDAAEVEAAIRGTRARVAINPDPAAGQSASLHVGLDASAQDTDAWLVALGDQPLIDPDVIDQMIAAWRAGRGAIVVPVYSGQRGNPVLFDRACRPALAALRGDQGARALLESATHSVHRLAVDAPVPRDIDTPDDLRRVQGFADAR